MQQTFDIAVRYSIIGKSKKNLMMNLYVWYLFMRKLCDNNDIGGIKIRFPWTNDKQH